MKKQLFYGDNLHILREYVKDETIDLVYLDPPFNSKATYNVLFKEKSGEQSEAQITAFDDTWHWNIETENIFQELVMTAQPNIVEMMNSFRNFIGTNDMMAYLTMMAPRLIELHRVLKDTGSIYLHCDTTASHYLKILLDTIFGFTNFKNEIVWKRTTSHSDGTKYGRNYDVIFFYTKTTDYIWNQQYTEHKEEYIRRFSHKDEDGRRWTDDNLSAKGLSGGGYRYEYKGIEGYWRCPIDTMKKLDEENRLYYTSKGGIRIKRYLDENKGSPVQALWNDINVINSQSGERLGYPTQKPEGLLERIIKSSSNEGDIVLDPFCGCGTAISVAEKLNREWIGIDITHLAVNLMKFRMKDTYGLEPDKDYEIHGEPKDIDGARDLALLDRYQFEWWSVSLIKAKPYGGKKKGADSGIDGVLFFQESDGKARKVIVQIKSGHTSVSHIRDLGRVIEREHAAIGIYICLEEPTKPMIKEAAEMGFYVSQGWGKNYPKCQILTIEQLLHGEEPKIPETQAFHSQAIKVDKDTQQDLF